MHLVQVAAMIAIIGTASAGVARRQGQDDFSSESVHATESPRTTESVHHHGGDDDRGRDRSGSSSDDHPHTESHHGQDDSSTFLATSTIVSSVSSPTVNGASTPAPAQNTAPAGAVNTNGGAMAISRDSLFDVVGLATFIGGMLVTGIGL